MIQVIVTKFSGYRSFWKFLILFFVSILFISYVISQVTTMGGGTGASPLGDLFVGSDVWKTICSVARWTLYIPAFFVIQLICAEYELKLIRAQIIAGYERLDVVGVMVLQNIFFAVIGVIFSSIVAAVLSLKTSGTWEIAAIGKAELGFFIYSIVFLNGAVLCATLMRKPIPSIILLILFPMVIEPLINLACERYGLPGIGKYLPFDVMSRLAPWPTGSEAFVPMSLETLLALGYGAVAAVAVWLRILRMDL